MLESRNSYGWGYVGTHQTGYDWHFVPDEKDPCYAEGNRWIGTVRGGEVFQHELDAIRAGEKWLVMSGRSGTIEVIKSEPYHFEY